MYSQRINNVSNTIRRTIEIIEFQAADEECIREKIAIYAIAAFVIRRINDEQFYNSFKEC